jgi:MFS family permease
MPPAYFSHLWNELSSRGRKTLPWDFIRGGCEGAGSTFVGTYALLIAIEFFHCSDEQKSLIAAGASWGLALSVFYATYAHALIGKRSIEAALPMFLGGIAIGLCSVAAGPSAYTLAAFFGSMFLGLRTPLLTAIYRENYSAAVRGQVFSLIQIVAAVSGVLLTCLGGIVLNLGVDRYPYLLMLLALGTLGGMFATLQIPSEWRSRERLPNPFSYFQVLFHDLPFVTVLASWFLVGIGNLAMIPQRFEYISKEEYGFSLSPGSIALVVGIIPEVTRVIAVLPMGRLFDRMNFIHLRILINLFLLAFQVVFFTAASIWQLVLGAVLLGIGNAGGSVAWSLWVTRYALPENTAKYMAMHTFFTGVRGIVAPYAGYWIAGRSSIGAAAWISAALIVVSCAVLVWVEWKVDPDLARRADMEIPEEDPGA